MNDRLRIAARFLDGNSLMDMSDYTAELVVDEQGDDTGLHTEDTIYHSRRTWAVKRALAWADALIEEEAKGT